MPASKDSDFRRRFCRLYLALGNPAEAAVRAGCPPNTAADDALSLLQSPNSRGYLAKLAAQPPLPLRDLVLAGLSRLAFGSAQDAVKLVFAEEMPSDDQLSRLDLFQVSEIKRIKGGGVEVKLFDRQKALEKLLECVSSADSDAAAQALLSALSSNEEEGNAHDCARSVLP